VKGALLLLMLAGCSPLVYTRGVPNLHQVEPGLWRGGEPTAEGWRYLRDELGVCATVQLDQDAERPAGVEPPVGIAVIAIPMPPATGVDVFLARQPRRADLVQAVLTMRGRSVSCAVFVHCLHGEDRTGLVVALYRWWGGWTREAAYAEAIALGFHRSLLGLVLTWGSFP
jgi:protein-tyrosine phosphatase